jgi:GAF domain-containing protein
LEAHERPVLSALARAATELTDASEATVVALRGQRVIVVAAAGREPRRRVGEHLAAGDDTLSFVLACGQSLSVVQTDGDRQGDATAPPQATARPASLCVPCVGAGGVVGALELSGRPQSGPFDVAATRVAELLAEIATAALAEDRASPSTAPTPEELASELAQLAAIDEARYRAIAWALESLLAGG